jgi:translation initiation factor eIF-2B subunit beta
MLMIALAAKEHSVPFVVCTGLYKLTPAYPVDQDTFNNRFNPNEILSYEQGENVVEIEAHENSELDEECTCVKSSL